MIKAAVTEGVAAALKQHFAVKARSSNAERQRRYRERKRNVMSNETVMPNKRKKRNVKSNEKVTPIPNGFQLPEWVPEMQWNAWIESRAKRRKAPTQFAKEMALSKLEKLRAEGHAPSAVLAQSAFNGWDGLFPVKEQR